MLVFLIGVAMVVLYPFSKTLYFAPQHFSLLFLFAHESFSHLALNLFSLLLIWLIAGKVGARESRLTLAFLMASMAAMPFSIMFSLPVMGASVGIYAMVGYLLPMLVRLVPMHVSYPVLSLLVLFEGGLTQNPWEKLFHFFGLTLGLVLHYMADARRLSLIQQMADLGMGYDPYAELGAGWPAKTKVVYKL